MALSNVARRFINMMQRWNPLGDFDRVWGEMDRLLNDSFVRPRALPRFSYRPAIDLYDQGDELVFKAVLPGAKPEDIELSVEQNTLTIRGKFGYTLGEDEAKSATWYRREIGFGEFAETISLPVQVDSGRAEANFTDGILTLRIPKAEQARVRRIPVKASNEVELPISGE
jgi:HSP20 family protein